MTQGMTAFLRDLGAEKSKNLPVHHLLMRSFLMSKHTNQILKSKPELEMVSVI